jgi:excisionase family DNA binding protein
MAEPDELLTVDEIATTLKMNPQTIRNWIDSGYLPALRIGRRVRFKRSDFDALLDASYTGTKQPPASGTATCPRRSLPARTWRPGNRSPTRRRRGRPADRDANDAEARRLRPCTSDLRNCAAEGLAQLRRRRTESESRAARGAVMSSATFAPSACTGRLAHHPGDAAVPPAHRLFQLTGLLDHFTFLDERPRRRDAQAVSSGVSELVQCNATCHGTSNGPNGTPRGPHPSPPSELGLSGPSSTKHSRLNSRGVHRDRSQHPPEGRAPDGCPPHAGFAR